MANRDLWLNSRAAIKTDLIRKTITLPGGTFNCGVPDYCIGVTQKGLPGFGSNVFANFGYTEVTFEVWFKPLSSGFETIILGNQSLELEFIHSANNELLTAITNTNAVQYISIISSAFDYNGWNHIAVVYDAITTDTMKVYVNGVLLDTLAITHNKAIKTAVQPFKLLSNPATNLTTSFGYISDLRVWNSCRTVDQINTYMWSKRNPVVDTTLLAYWPMDEGAGSPTREDVAGVFNFTLTSGVEWKADRFPDRYGASFVCAQYIIEGDRKCSLRFPVEAPEDVDHALVVMWVDHDEVVHRRYLYTAEGVDFDIQPYAGERLSDTFRLEVWNVDGNATATLPETILYTSVTSNPTSGSDRTSEEYVDDPVVDTALAENFPLTFPLSFNSQQVY